MDLSLEDALATLETLAGGRDRPAAARERAATLAARPLTRSPLGAELRRAEARYRGLVEQIPAVTFMVALEEGPPELYVSPQIETLLGYSQEEWVSDPILWYQQLHPDDRETLHREFARGCASGGPFRAECRFFTRDGRVVWLHGEARMLPDESGNPQLLQGVAFDITESKRAEEIVREALREKETLLKEIHHRVKNNLQITSSLLQMQASRIRDPEARRLLEDSQNRIRSLALVHEVLYRGKQLSQVDFGEYTRNIVALLFQSYGTKSSPMVRTEIRDVGLGIDVAVPCALIINELLSNALKHAFPTGSRTVGEIVIRFAPQGSDYELVVADNGVGLVQPFDPRKTGTLGLQLVGALVRQLGGRYEIRSEGGTAFRITFPQAKRP